MGIKEARARAGMTVLYVSHVLGVSPQAVYQWESGETKPTVQNLVNMSGLYCCTVDELLDNTKEVEQYDTYT